MSRQGSARKIANAVADGGGGLVNAARKHVIYQCMRRDAAKARVGMLPARASKLLYSGVTADLTRQPLA